MRIRCEVCNQEGYIQKLGNYYRVRPYQSIDKTSGKSKFYYHQQNQVYAESQMNLIRKSEILECDAGNFKVEQLSAVQNLYLKYSGFISSGRSLVWSSWSLSIPTYVF